MLQRKGNHLNFESFCGIPGGPSFGVYIRDIGFHKTPPLHVYGPAVRDYWLIHVVKTGKGWFMKDGIKTPLSAGDCFFIRPMEVTTYCSDESEPWQYFWVGFNGKFAAELAEFALSGVSTAHVGKQSIAAIEALYRKYDSQESVNALETLSGLYEVLAKIKNSVSPEQKSPTDVVDEAIRYVENNYFRSVSISALADALGVARTYFTTEFTQRTGVSPYAYLTDYRIAKARELLAESDLRVSEIAYSVGFSGVERFSDMFRRRTGLSPTEYRRRVNAEKTE